MTNRLRRIFKIIMSGTGFTVIALALPLIKFYALAPGQFLQTFKFLA